MLCVRVVVVVVVVCGCFVAVLSYKKFTLSSSRPSFAFLRGVALLASLAPPTPGPLAQYESFALLVMRGGQLARMLLVVG